MATLRARQQWQQSQDDGVGNPRSGNITSFTSDGTETDADADADGTEAAGRSRGRLHSFDSDCYGDADDHEQDHRQRGRRERSSLSPTSASTSSRFFGGGSGGRRSPRQRTRTLSVGSQHSDDESGAHACRCVNIWGEGGYASVLCYIFPSQSKLCQFSF